MRAREVDHQMPRPPRGELPQEAQAIFGQPVVAVGVVGQGGSVGVHVSAAVGVLLDVDVRQPATGQERQVRPRRPAVGPVAARAVELALVVDPLGEAPLGQQPRAVEVPAHRLGEVLVQVELAHPRHAIARIPQGLVVRGLIQRVVLAVVDDAAAVVAPARRHRRPRRRAQRRGAIRPRKSHPARGEAIEARRDQRQVGITRQPVRPMLVGKEEQNVRSTRTHRASFGERHCGPSLAADQAPRRRPAGYSGTVSLARTGSLTGWTLR